MKHFVPFALSLLLVGCGTTAQKSDEDVMSAQALQECLSATHITPMYRACFNRGLTDADFPKAKQRWNSFLNVQEPDIRMLGAVYMSNPEALKAALVAGANANREFSDAVTFGRPGKENKVALTYAMSERNSDVVEILLQNGANPKWKSSATSSEVVASYLFYGYGLKHIELAFRYGYRPDAKSLESIEFFAKDSIEFRAFFDKVWNASSPQVKAEFNARKLATEERNKQAELEATAKREKERVEQQRQRAERENLRVASLRELGTRICTQRDSVRGVVTYLGYVENLGPRKVQIRVAQAFYRDTPALAPGDFQPSILWDELGGWQAC